MPAPAQPAKPSHIRAGATPRPVELRRVVVFIEREIGYRHSVLRGIFKYAQHAGNWLCQGCNLNTETVDMMLRMRPRPHGVIAGLYDLALAKRLGRLRLPLIDVYDWFPLPGSRMRRVNIDNHAVGVLAARHLLARGFRQAAFFGHSVHHFSTERRRGFVAEMQRAGVNVQVAPRDCSDIDVWRHTHPMPRRPLTDWLRSLPRPTAVFCASDAWGMVLSEACHAVGLEIPDQIAVLGVDNDELLCTLSRPPLSSVDIAADRVGYQAAEMLDRLMAGQSDAAVDVLLPPGEVVERQSTNVLQVADADIAMALRFIRNNAHRPLHIDDVTHHVVMPRRTLQRRFREAIGHSFSQEVERCRLELAKRLLAETDLPVPQVARRCGYRDRERLWGAFRRLAGSSPFEYRRQFRQGMD